MKEMDDLKRKLRGLKKVEERIRFQEAFYGDKTYVWNNLFSTNVQNEKVKYPLSYLLQLNKEEIQEVIQEFFFLLYFQKYKERGLVLESFYDPSLLSALDLSPAATTEEIKRKFRLMAKKHHPDHGGDSEKMMEILDIYQKLMAKG